MLKIVAKKHGKFPRPSIRSRSMAMRRVWTLADREIGSRPQRAVHPPEAGGDAGRFLAARLRVLRRTARASTFQLPVNLAARRTDLTASHRKCERSLGSDLLPSARPSARQPFERLKAGRSCELLLGRPASKEDRHEQE